MNPTTHKAIDVPIGTIADDGSGLAALAGQGGLITWRTPEQADIDAADNWDTDSDYVGDNNVSFVVEIPATGGPYLDIDGNELELGKTYLAQYAADRAATDSVTTIADDAATVAEFALMRAIGGVGMDSSNPKVNVADEATQDDVNNGTEGKWVDAALLAANLKEILYKNTIPEVSNGAGSNIGPIETTFTAPLDGDYTLEYSGTVVSGTGGISVGTATGLNDLFVSSPATGDADGSRLTVTRQDNFTPPITLTAGQEIFITQWAGGGGLIQDTVVCVLGQDSQDKVNVSDEATQADVDNSAEGKWVDAALLAANLNSRSFGSAQLSINEVTTEVERKHLTVTNANGNKYGISSYKYHLSDDPAVVGTLTGSTIEIDQGEIVDLYLVGPSTEGLPADGDLEHNGTVTGVHFTVEFDGSDLVYNVIEAVRHHPGPGDYETRSYNSVVSSQTVALTLLETDFDLLFSGYSISADTAAVKTATAKFTSTNGVCVPVDGKYQENMDGTTLAIPSVAEYNEFINNYKPQYLALSYEGAGGSTAIINVNGVAATFKDLTNATDVGNGQINFSSGANSNFNRLARVDGELLKNVGDYVEISGINVASYSGMYIGIFDNETDFAHSTTNVYRLIAAAGINQNSETYSFRDAANTVLASGSETNAVYRITRTLGGISFARAGVELYCTEVDQFIDYLASPTSGSFVVDGVNVDAALPWVGSVITTNGVTEVISTGVDLNEVEEVRVTFGRSNNTWGKIVSSFDPSEIDFDVDQGKLLLHFDNTYLSIRQMSAAQFAAGDIPFRAITNSGVFGFEITRIEFKKRAVVDEGRELLFTSAAVNTGATVSLDSMTWQEVVTRYESIVVNSRVANIGFTNEIDTSRFTDGGTVGGTLTSAIHFALSSTDFADGNFGYATTNNSQNAQELEIWGVLPHGRVSGLPSASSSVDPIPEFAATLKTDVLEFRGRPYTVLTDSGATSETTERTFDSTVTPFVVIELLRDDSATHGPMIRFNTPSTGRQSQVRLNLTNDTHTTANSGANTAPPAVMKSVVGEYTITHYIEILDPVAHTELEIAPASHDAALTPTPAITGSTGVFDVMLYETNPIL